MVKKEQVLRGRQKLTTDQHEALGQDFLKGPSIRELSDKYGISQSTTRYWVRKLHLGETSVREWNATENPRAKARKAAIEKAKGDLGNGMSVSEIAKKYGWAESTTYRYLNVAPNRKPSGKWVEKAMADLRKGMSVGEISVKYKRAHSTVSESLALRLGMSVSEWTKQQAKEKAESQQS